MINYIDVLSSFRGSFALQKFDFFVYVSVIVML